MEVRLGDCYRHLSPVPNDWKDLVDRIRILFGLPGSLNFGLKVNLFLDPATM